jgi:predicted DNA-binding protein YlxM (UPF0122 family)
MDRISILKIKSNEIKDEKKLLNINKELSSMEDIADKSGLKENELYSEFLDNLFKTNTSLWKVEEKLREFEEKNCFNDLFVECARNVYKLNDYRAKLK